MTYPSIDSENEVQNINEFRVNGWEFEKIIIDNVKYLKIKSTYPTVNIGFYIDRLMNSGYQPYFYPPDLINVNKFKNIENILISQETYNHYSDSLVPVDTTINSSRESDFKFIYEDEINESTNERKINKYKSAIIGLSISLLIMVCIILMYLLDVF